MSKGTRYELMLYVCPIEGSCDYMIVSSKPFPALLIGQVFKSYPFEKNFKLDDDMEYRIRDIEIVHCSRSEEPHIWQTKILLTKTKKRKALSFPDGDRLTREAIEYAIDEEEGRSPESSVIRSHWNLVQKLSDD